MLYDLKAIKWVMRKDFLCPFGMLVSLPLFHGFIGVIIINFFTLDHKLPMPLECFFFFKSKIVIRWIPSHSRGFSFRYISSAGSAVVRIVGEGL